jgi:hypothetical protein
MKIIFKMALIFSLVLSLSFPSAAGLFSQSGNVEALLGTWDVELTEMGMQMEFIFKMEDDALSGALEFEMGSGIMEEITFEDNKLTFLVSLDAGGQTVNVEGTSTVDGDEMTGTMFTEMGDAEFTGIKRKES